MGDSMLLVDREGRMFDPDGVMQILSEISGVTNLTKGKGDRHLTRTIEADYTHGGETTHTRLLPTAHATEPTEYSTLRIDDFSNAGFTLALEFNARHAKLYGRCLDVFTQSYDFHQRLKEDMTLEALMDLINNDPYAGEPSNDGDAGNDDSPEAPIDST